MIWGPLRNWSEFTTILLLFCDWREWPILLVFKTVDNSIIRVTTKIINGKLLYKIFFLRSWYAINVSYRWSIIYFCALNNRGKNKNNIIWFYYCVYPAQSYSLQVLYVCLFWMTTADRHCQSWMMYLYTRSSSSSGYHGSCAVSSQRLGSQGRWGWSPWAWPAKYEQGPEGSCLGAATRDENLSSTLKQAVFKFQHRLHNAQGSHQKSVKNVRRLPRWPAHKFPWQFLTFWNTFYLQL